MEDTPGGGRREGRRFSGVGSSCLGRESKRPQADCPSFRQGYRLLVSGHQGGRETSGRFLLSVVLLAIYVGLSGFFFYLFVFIV